MDIIDHVRVEIDGDQPPGILANIATNPNGDLGGAGWVTPVAGSRMVTRTDAHRLEYRTVKNTANYFWVESFAVTPGQWLGASFVFLSTVDPITIRARWSFTDAGGNFLPASPQTGALTPRAERWAVPAYQVPTGAVTGRLRFDVYGNAALINPPHWKPVQFNRVMIATGPTSAAVTNPAFNDTRAWLDITGGLTGIKITRAELDVGTLTCVSRDAALHPQTSNVLRTGRRVRVSAYDPAAGEWDTLFIGTLDRPTVATDKYALTTRPERAHTITIGALDDNTRIASKTQIGGLFGDATVLPNLPMMLEGAGVPWSVQGNTGQVAASTYTYQGPPGTTLMDHLIRLRPSELNRNLYLEAFVNRRGILQIRWRDIATAWRDWTTDYQLLADPAFTIGVDEWSAVANISTVAYIAAGGGNQGVMRIASTAAGFGSIRTDRFLVRPGSRLTQRTRVSLFAPPTSSYLTSEMRRFHFYDRAGSLISSTAWVTDAVPPLETVPDLAVSARLELGWNFTAANQSLYVYFAGVVAGYAGRLDGAEVSDRDLGWATEHMVNDLAGSSWYVDTSGKQQEEQYDIGTDATSIATYGRRAATVNLVALRSFSDLPTLRANLIASNAPYYGLRSATIPLDTPGRVARHAFWDICDRVDNPWSPENTTVREVVHEITPQRWLLHLTVRQREIPIT